ncbi:hypothetical protein LDG_7742 [Legionella drancourtii LLAP12]|uniref:Uncharacterized protein n=1 Tax=Legionella drancourtii LLAP12 TaxID=658187 RepID=G9ER32_9GAMM|nr:hypothetical protein LDG_7742 [Legionella drancourtii LLAP12]
MDNYRDKQRQKDLAKYAQLFPNDEDAANKIAKNLASSDPYFFRKKLDKFLEDREIISGNKEVTKLRVLLGPEGTKLFQLARREERFDKDYINAVVDKSLMSSTGAKWITRPVVPLLGPSASGKSFVKKQVLDEINNKTAKSLGSTTENGLVFSDGGIERDESSVRKLMIAFGVKSSCKDITDLDKKSASKLKENILKAAVLSPDLGIVIVDTASKYYHGRVPSFVSDLLPTLENLAADPKNNVIPVCIVGEDDETFGETVSFMGNSRSQAREKHFKAIPADKTFSLMNLPENLPEFKKYEEKHRQKGIIGSEFIINALNKEAVYSINDLVLKTLDKHGELQKGGESIEGTMLVSNRIFKEWNNKTEAEKLASGFKAAASVFSEPKGDCTIALIRDNDKWIKDDNSGVPNATRIYVNADAFEQYRKNPYVFAFDAYKTYYSKPLMHTAGEYVLFKIKKEIEKTPNVKQEPHLNMVLEHMAKLHIGGGPVEGPKLDRVKDSPALIDAFAKELIALEGKIPSSMHSELSKGLEQIRNEVKLRQLIAHPNDVKPQHNSKDRMFYDTREFFDIKTTVKNKNEADNDLIAKKANTASTAAGATVVPTEVAQDEVQEVVYKGDFLKNDQVIVAEAEIAPGKILYLEQNKTGKVVDRSTANLNTDEKQVAALKQAQMLLNNYDPSKGRIVIRGRDKEQAERLYAAVLYFIKNDPEIKKRMESPRWILPSTYSPEKLMRCTTPGFVPPKTISSGFIAKKLPIIKTLDKEQLEVLSVDKRAVVEESIMQTNKAIDVVKTQKDYKAHVRQIRQAERAEVDADMHIPVSTTPQSR